MPSYGPQEDYDSQWRTTNTHTPEEMQSVYREVFFAGLPDYTQGNQEALGNLAMHQFDAAALLRGMFEQFGPVTKFHYDDKRGVGAVTFEKGEDGERCFVSANGTIIMTPDAIPPQFLTTGVMQDNFALLYVEFAQFLPFSNSLMLKKSLSGNMSRLLLRTFPRSRHFTPTSCDLNVLFDADTDGELEAWVRAKLLPSSGKTIGNVTPLDAWHWYYTNIIERRGQERETGSGVMKLPFWYQLKAAIRDNTSTLSKLRDDDDWRCTFNYLMYKSRLETDGALVEFLNNIHACGGLNKVIVHYTSPSPSGEAHIGMLDMTNNILQRCQNDFGKVLELLDRRAASSSIESMYAVCGPVQEGELDPVTKLQSMRLVLSFLFGGAAAKFFVVVMIALALFLFFS